MKKNYLLKTLFLFVAISFGGGYGFSQTFCPNDTSYYADSGSCETSVNFSAPAFDSILAAEFNFTGDTAMWVVPAGIDSVKIESWGAQGNLNAMGVAGGLGGYAAGWLMVNANDTLYIFVGGGADTSTAGGWNGGGMAGDTANACSTAYGGGGGGGTDVRYMGDSLNHRVIVAGGGGGAGGDRVAGCGRGTGGGGGGGYYGGGGGAAWPYQSTIVPTGGTQSAGGIGGTSTWTNFCTGCNYGHPGGLGYGGFGGEEESGSQGGSAVGLPGGTGGGLSGGSGSYSANWTGQSGAGGSGYIGGVTNGSMQDGIHAGAGRVVITYAFLDTTYQVSGVSNGDTVQAGTYQQLYVGEYGGFNDTCGFEVTVWDTLPPTAVCQNDTVSLDTAGTGAVNAADIDNGSLDNCSLSFSLLVGPTFGCSDVGSSFADTLVVEDPSGNKDSCTTSIYVVDEIGPTANCQNISVILDGNGMYMLTASEVDNNSTDNCSVASLSVSQTAFDTSNVGLNTVTLLVTDASGNVDSCSADVTVQDTMTGIVDGFGIKGVDFLAYPNPAHSTLSVQITCDNCDLSQDMVLQLVTVQGSVIKTQSVNLSGGVYQSEINLEELSAGLYLLNLSSLKGSIYQRIVKE